MIRMRKALEEVIYQASRMAWPRSSKVLLLAIAIDSVNKAVCVKQ